MGYVSGLRCGLRWNLADCTVARVLGPAFSKPSGVGDLTVLPDTSGDIARARRDVP